MDRIPQGRCWGCIGEVEIPDEVVGIRAGGGKIDGEVITLYRWRFIIGGNFDTLANVVLKIPSRCGKQDTGGTIVFFYTYADYEAALNGRGAQQFTGYRMNAKGI